MAKVKQPYGEPRIVPWLDDQVVNPGQVVDIPDDQLASFLEAGWEQLEAKTKTSAQES